MNQENLFFFDVAVMSYKNIEFLYYPKSGLVNGMLSFHDYILNFIGCDKQSDISGFLDKYDIPCMEVISDGKKFTIRSDEITVIKEYNEDSLDHIDDVLPVPGQMLLLKIGYDYDIVLCGILNPYSEYRFMNGLCNLFAETLHDILGKGVIKSIRGPSGPDHAFLLIDGKYIDITGVHSKSDFYTLNKIDDKNFKITDYSFDFNGKVNCFGMTYVKSIVNAFVLLNEKK